MKYLSLEFKDCRLDVNANVKSYNFLIPTLAMLDALRRCFTPQEARNSTLEEAMIRTRLPSNEQQRNTIIENLMDKNALQDK